MLKNILVPLDGSPAGEAALPYARALARRSGAKLTLVRATHASGGPLSSGESQARAVADAELYLSMLAAAETNVAVETAVPYGSPAAWIGEEVKLRDVDLIVMATHDRTGPERWVRGSVAEAVVSQATVPALIVRAASASTPGVRLEQSQPTLVVPLDGSPFAEAALTVAQEFASVLNARIVLVGVVPDPTRVIAGAEGAVLAYSDEDIRVVRMETRDYLRSIADRLNPMLTTETVVRLGDAAAEIALEAEDRGAAAVIMATHGRTGVARAILGSVAGGVLHRSASPVVLVRPPKLRAAKGPARTTPAITTDSLTGLGVAT
jgi:nucleotide-binding universal stress UspA family protein